MQMCIDNKNLFKFLQNIAICWR